MRPRSNVAAFLAVLVLGYTSFATFLECGMHAVHAGRPTAAHHHHDHGVSPEHTDHGGAAPRGGDPVAPACCHTTLYNAVFQSVGALQLVRAEALVPVPASLAATLSAGAVVATTAGRHWATGPPYRTGPIDTLFSARPRYLALSSFLV